MRFHQALGIVIAQEREFRDLKLRDVSSTGAVSLGHLSEIERGIKEASSSVIEGIAKALGVSASYLIVEAGYLMGVSELPNTIEDFIGEHPASANPSPV